MSTGQARYETKRIAGISPIRKDGSLCNVNNDIESAAAEEFAAKSLGVPFNSWVGITGDGGHDFRLSIKVEVIWMGLNKSGAPREKGHLIVNPDEPHRWAPVYVMVSGDTTSGFKMIGWASHDKLVSLPMKDFGFGMKYAMPTDSLYPMKSLTGLVSVD